MAGMKRTSHKGNGTRTIGRNVAGRSTAEGMKCNAAVVKQVGVWCGIECLSRLPWWGIECVH